MRKLKDKICYVNKQKEKDRKEGAGKKFIKEKGKKDADMSNQILTSQFKEQLELEEEKDVLEKRMQQILQNDKNDYANSESFETDSFDIYNPNNTIETFSSQELNERENEENTFFSNNKVLKISENFL